MKVTVQTPERLVLDWHPWAIRAGFGLLALGLGCIVAVWLLVGDWAGAAKAGLAFAMAAFGFVVFSRHETAEFDRATLRVTVRSTGVWRFEVTRDLAGLTGVAVRRNPSTFARRSIPCRPELIFADGSALALTQAYISGGSADRVAAAVRLWCGLPAMPAPAKA